MRKIATMLVVTSLVAMVLLGFQPSGAEEPENARPIGVYHRLGSDEKLTSEHISWNEGGMEVEGPVFTDKIQVETAYLEEELGSWGSQQKFSIIDGFVEIDARTATFEGFHLGEEPIFTQGAGNQVELLERPMWLNASQEEHGERITLTMEDGDSSGQQIFISRDWLWGRGVQWFNVTHEDGTVLPVTEQSGGVIVDVPHFSEVHINPEGLDVKQVIGGVTVDNQGESRWFWQESVLEVDVDYNPEQEYEVLIPADWTDLHVRPHTFKVYSSGQLVDNPDTGLQVCCGGGGGSQNYYSVKFSTSGLSVRIEVIGEHIPVYTMQDGALAPHWGEKRWNETTTVLEVDVDEQSSDYEVWIKRNWVEIDIPFAGALNHNWTTKSYLSTEYFVLSVPTTPSTIIVQPVPQQIEVDDPYENDPYQEVVAMNVTSVRLALTAGYFPVNVLGDDLILETEYRPKEIQVNSTDGDNGTFEIERFLLNNTDPFDNMTGEISLNDDNFTMTMIFTTKGKFGSYWGGTENETHSLDGKTYRQVKYFDPINVTLELPPFQNETSQENEDPIGDVLSSSMNYMIYMDREALRLSGESTITDACRWAADRFPKTEQPFTAVGVQMEMNRCWGDWSLVATDPEDIEAALNQYISRFHENTLPIDLVVFLSGHDFIQGSGTSPRGTAKAGPETLRDSDDPRRYGITTINPNSYPHDADKGSLLHQYAATIVILHEIGHTMRTDHGYEVHTECDRIHWEPQSGTTIMGAATSSQALTDQYCFMFSDEEHDPSLPTEVCGADEGTNSGKRIRCASFIYSQERDRYW